MRVHELAKELGLSSKDLVGELARMGIDVKSHMSTLTDDQAQRVHAQRGTAVATATEPTPPPAEETHAEPSPEVPAAEAPAEELPAEPPAEPEPEPEPEPQPKRFTLKGPVIVKDFAEMIGTKPNRIIAELMGMNVFASINEKIEFQMAQQLAKRHGFTIEREKKPTPPPPPVKKPEPVAPVVDTPAQLQSRPPVVTFLGHVDHGKTSLLDRIRKTTVVDGEFGGITQHIGAYTVEYKDQKITFLDTPGHAAFTAMRARGANITDIAVLIIAADDGIMPQTREAIQHAKAAGVTIMVAVNKMDLPGANIDRVKQQLQQEELAPEDWGGDIVCCPVSAETGDGIDDLLEMILLQAEVLQLTANPDRTAQGFVVEAQLEPGMGPTANLLVQQGTLKVGDAMICGPYWGRIKALINDKGIKVRTAGPSTPVKCMGLTSVPEAGAEFRIIANAREARDMSEQRLADERKSNLRPPERRASLDDLMNMTDPTSVKELSVIVKADVQGSVEAVQHILEEIKSDKVQLECILAGAGNVTANDVLLASASNAIIVGFHVAKENGVNSLAKREGVEIRLYNVIYEILDDVQVAMTGLLEPESRERATGQAEIRQVFTLSKRGCVAGCMVVGGRISANAKARIKRAGDEIFVGSITSLRRYQSEANEVRDGQECGLRVGNYKDYEVGDVIETYEIDKIAPQL